MIAAALSFRQIKAQVLTIRQKRPQERVIGLQTAERWSGAAVQQDGAETWKISQCDSPLQIRLALQEDDGSDIHVLLTNLPEQELGEDVLLRLARQRLFPIDSWEIVKTLFQAHTIDPRLIRHGWMAEALFAMLPSESFAPAPGGFLDVETVWPLLLEHYCHFPSAQPDCFAVLQWSTQPQHVAAFCSASEPLRQAATEWLIQQAGPVVEAVLHCITAEKRPDALALGLALGVVFHPTGAGRLEKAAGKLEERYLGGHSLDASIVERWHAAATEVVAGSLSATPRQARSLQHADDILREVQADKYAYLSSTSPLGFEQRLGRFGSLLAKLVDSETVDTVAALSAARQEILQHARAPYEGRRLQPLGMALRLVRWLANVQQMGLPAVPSLPAAASYHIAEGSFLDWARFSLHFGEPLRALSTAYSRLFQRLTALREQQAQRFAELLRDWTAAASPGDEVLVVERVLEEIVTPLAAQCPILLIVMDGMSAAVAQELVADITRHGWRALCEPGRQSTRPGLAMLPSVTEVSRSSLLCGQALVGDASVEKKAFAEHLRAHGRSAAILFHKLALQEADDASLAEEVRAAIASPQQRVVGVVLNAVDDFLFKGEQLNTHWSCDTIKILPTLLYEAKNAQRLVILLSDHGHIVEHHTQGRKNDTGGERWRQDGGTVAADELRITGNRVLLGDQQCLIAPWSEKVRYGGKKNGYHGGISPQEMVIPITVLGANEAIPTGWSEATVATPDWWDEPFVARQPESAIAPPEEPLQGTGFGPLFDFAQQQIPLAPAAPQAAPSPAAWIATLLHSPLLVEQKRLAGRKLPSDEDISKLLEALEQHGGTLTATALARALHYPVFRLPGLLAKMQRLLNLDGYVVLRRDAESDTVVFNRALLFQQFEMNF